MPTLGISGQEKVSPCLALQAVSQGSVPHAVVTNPFFSRAVEKPSGFERQQNLV